MPFSFESETEDVQVFSEETEEETEEERRKREEEEERLRLEEEEHQRRLEALKEEEIEEEEEVEVEEPIIEEVEADISKKSEVFSGFTITEPPITGGRYLDRAGTAEGVVFYKDDSTNKYVTVNTITHERENGTFVNMPALLDNGFLIALNPSETQADQLFDYWKKKDPGSLEIYNTREEAEEAAKVKSIEHTEIGKRANIIKGYIEEGDDEGLFELGARIERHTAANLFRLAKAGALSIFKNIDYREALKKQETERMDKIFSYMQEKYGKDFRGRENELKVMAGRIVTAFADPVTFFLPWAKVAKMGKMAATGFGVGVGVGDMALYEYAAYGEVTPTSLLFAGSMGGISSFGGKLLADKFKAPRGKDMDISVDKGGKKITKKNTIVDEPEVKPTAKELDDMERVAVEVINDEDMVTVFKRLGSDLSIMPTFIRLIHKAKTDQVLYRNALKENKKVLEIFKKETQQAKQVTLFELKPELPHSPQKVAALKKKNAAATKLLKQQTPWMVRIAEGTASIQNGALIRHAKEGTLSDNILNTIMYESFRPIMGGGLGYLSGSFIADEDSDPSLIYSFVFAGMFLGLAQKQIQKTPFLTAQHKEKAFGIFKNQRMIALHNFLKIQTAGTAASKGISHGGPVETITRLLYHIQGGAGKKSINSAEKIADYLMVEFSPLVAKVIGGSTEIQRIATFRIINNLDTLKSVTKKLSLTAEDIANVKVLIPNVKRFRDNFVNTYVKGSGKEFESISNYGLPHSYLFDKIVESIKDVPENQIRKSIFWKQMNKAVKEQWSENIKKVRGKEAKKKWANDRTDSIVNSLREAKTKQLSLDELIYPELRVGAKGHESGTGIPLLDNFDKARQITKTKALRHIEDFLEQDVDRVLKLWVDNTVRGIEFGRAMGIRTSIKGGRIFENLRHARRSLNAQTARGEISKQQLDDKLKFLGKQVNGYFKTIGTGQEVFGGDNGRGMMAVLTFLGNTTMLTRSGIIQLADLVQPFQNSRNFSAVRSLLRMHVKKQDFAKELGFAGYYESLRGTAARSAWEKEKLAHMIEGPYSWVGEWTNRFFRFNQMTPLTDYSIKFSFNNGIEEAFIMAKKLVGKKKISKRHQNKLNELGLFRKDLKLISKFKDLGAAMKDPVAQVPLIRAGINGWNFNTLIPTSGNRLHFAQHHDPYVRSLGMFLSWAQAKTAQMNSLVRRVEDGDVALAIKMIGALTIYGGIREMQIVTSPSVKYYEDNKPKMLSGKWFQEAATVGGIIPWPVEKMTRFLGGGAISTPIENITPLFAYINRLLGTPRAVGADLGAKDFEGAAVEILKPLPFGRDITNITNRVLGLRGGSFEDLPNDEFERRINLTTTAPVLSFFKGGLVSKDYPVPNVIEDPSERIDPNTGLPYDAEMERLGAAQGGDLTIDPLHRLGFTGGGLAIDPLYRLGFTGGGLMVSVGVAPISEKQISKLEKALKKRKAKREGGKIRQQFGLGGLGKLVKALVKRREGKRIVGRTENKKYYLTNYGEGSIPVEEQKKAKALEKVKESLDQYFDKERLRKIIKKDEGYSSTAYKPDPTEEKFTLGYGVYGAEKNDTTTKEEADKRLDAEIDKRLPKLVEMLPGSKHYNKDLQDAIFSVHWRGDIEQGTETRKLIQKGHYKKAAAEFLRHEEYNNAEALGIPGIRPRMERFSNELRRLHELRGYVP